MELVLNAVRIPVRRRQPILNPVEPQFRKPAQYLLLLLWRDLGEAENAKSHALAAYKWAWADGEPHVYRYELTRAKELLDQLNVPVPELPPYDPAKHPPFPWEAGVRKAIERIRAEREATKK